jgi:hypothetical protein
VSERPTPRMPQYPDIGLGSAAQYLHGALVPANARFRQKQTRETLLAVASPAWLCVSGFGTIKAAIPI